MAKYHVNSKGEPGICSAQSGNCPFGGENDHYSSAEDARVAFEKSQDSFAVVIKKSDSPDRSVQAPDSDMDGNIAKAQAEYDASEDKARWIEDKVSALDGAKANLNQTLPGSVERLAATNARREAREALLAADLVVWRSSPFYSESVGERMKETSVIVSDADTSIESALADEAGKQKVASQYGMSVRDVENILEVTHQDYLRPRAPMNSAIGELSSNENYAATTAYVFRVEPEAVKGVLSYASNYSGVESRSNREDVLAGFDLI